MSNERIEAILKDPKKYTESANFTTTAIKCNGDYLSTSEIIDRLNHINKLESVIQMCFNDACSASGKISKKTVLELCEYADRRAY